jgi:hypothetical protein
MHTLSQISGSGQTPALVTTAIAPEMAAFLWAIGHEVEPSRYEARDFVDELDQFRGHRRSEATSITAVSLALHSIFAVRELHHRCRVVLLGIC